MSRALIGQISALRWYFIISLVRLCYQVRLESFGEWIGQVTGLRLRLECLLDASKGGAK